MKNIFVINGSASSYSSNQKLITLIVDLTQDTLNIKVFNDLKTLPHFDPELSIENTPEEILKFRKEIEIAEGVLICTPEYVFSIPSGLKNVIEWCVSTTVFSGKPLGIITASAHGEKGHVELQLIMETLMANFTTETTLLISGIKGKINEKGQLTDSKTNIALLNFLDAFENLMP
ncbi:MULTISPECIES: NADPH-dependent FMN reductase [unclassified Sphingobacterium]|uniref:NADPH-dependent FMN reductase n=1 Tax=unclassified Sphingobacterium TaxID=2609468 RepID=UPI00104972D5|nr:MULTISPECIES: NADPH-dependent FMN reductase [unclassified Sphingobacterium]MCS3556448.1 NAD(P)H-dependent FMN reductase [Sphingobacterium sp. JUb21]TCR08814.1 NAD(P)H-dependent FMN reductase [Sphingobacterium sp. JUb20]